MTLSLGSNTQGRVSIQYTSCKYISITFWSLKFAPGDTKFIITLKKILFGSPLFNQTKGNRFELFKKISNPKIFPILINNSLLLKFFSFNKTWERLFPNSKRDKEGIYSYKITKGFARTSCIILLFIPTSAWEARSKLSNIIGNSGSLYSTILVFGVLTPRPVAINEPK